MNSSTAPFIMILVATGIIEGHEAEKLKKSFQGQRIEEDWYKLYIQVEKAIGRPIVPKYK